MPRRNGHVPTHRLHGRSYLAIWPVRELLGSTPASDFGPKSLNTVRQKMVNDGLARTNINHHVSLEKRVEMAFLAPLAVVVVVAELAGGKLANQRVSPVRQLHAKAACFAAEQAVGSLHGFRQAKPVAANSDGVGVADFGFDGYDVAQWCTPF